MVAFALRVIRVILSWFGFGMIPRECLLLFMILGVLGCWWVCI